jgi:hypothetical protein
VPFIDEVAKEETSFILSAWKCNSTCCRKFKCGCYGLFLMKNNHYSSLNLNVCDFYLYGNLKQKVYRNNPHTFKALQTEIPNVILEIKEN